MFIHTRNYSIGQLLSGVFSVLGACLSTPNTLFLPNICRLLRYSALSFTLAPGTRSLASIILRSLCLPVVPQDFGICCFPDACVGLPYEGNASDREDHQQQKLIYSRPANQ